MAHSEYRSVPRHFGRFFAVMFGGAVLLTGLVLFAGGAQLISLGGSPYYVLAGIGLIISGALLGLRRIAGARIYLLTFVATILWAYWEVGFDFWQLVPRIAAPTVCAIIVFVLISTRAVGNFNFAVRVASAALAALLFVGVLCGIAYAMAPHYIIAPSTIPRAPLAQASNPGVDIGAWQYYGRTPKATRYAPFDQINRDNVRQLNIAWVFRTGDPAINDAEDQNTPIQIGNTLYVCTPHNIVFALNAETGEQRWKYDPKVTSPLWHRCRGVGYFDGQATKAMPGRIENRGDCVQRVILTTTDARVIALDGTTGRPCADFGDAGTVDLRVDMGEVKPGFYFPTSAPTVVRDLIVVGGWVWDNVEVGEPSGVVRAFSVYTGKLVWAWDLDDPNSNNSPAAGKTFSRGTPNMWSTPSFDDGLGLIYLPLGNSTPDFWGAHRSSNSEKYSSSVVALDIATGRERWRFQTVHHDLWDYDVASQPILYDIPDGQGNGIPALIQPTKTGQIFLLERRTGKPLAEVVEKPAPQGAENGDWTSPTQPYSVGMPDIGANRLSEKDMWGTTPLDQLWCRIKFKSMRYEGAFTPPATRPTMQYPGGFGGMNWGSAAIDEDNGYLVVNDIRVPHFGQLISREAADLLAKADATKHGGLAPQLGTPFGFIGGMFRSPLGIPCQKPPYGVMTAIDLKSRQIVWQIPLGTLEDYGPFGLKTGLPIPIGLPALAGPLATRSGLIFYSGTHDHYLRAIDVLTGEELWKGRLPVGSQATPMSFISPQSGRQFVVLTAGGTRLARERGDYVVAYALPE